LLLCIRGLVRRRRIRIRQRRTSPSPSANSQVEAWYLHLPHTSENEPESGTLTNTPLPIVPQQLIHCFIYHTIRVRFAEWHASFASLPPPIPPQLGEMRGGILHSGAGRRPSRPLPVPLGGAGPARRPELRGPE
jgi:hypothetical protein